jgi:predicted nucleotidyltransferase component of viral defense system
VKDLIQKKLEHYKCQTSEDEENALKEITQEVALFALQKSGFFTVAAFQGGTCLRIVHGLDRFSEDLDFALHQPDLNFSLESFLTETQKIMNTFGYNIEVTGQDKLENHVKMRFLKDESIKLQLKLMHHFDLKKKIQIKVEVDINPPDGSDFVPAFVDFPLDFAIKAHDLPSLFAGKCHALLCRGYTKGRDWFDFSWYIARRIKPNLSMLTNALQQAGPWKGQNIEVDQGWLEEQLRERIKHIKWQDTMRDVERFLRADQRESLGLWSEAFFAAKIAKMFRG